MPIDSQWAIQTLIYDILKDDTNLQAVLAGGAAGVYDHVPDGAAFPYCAINDIEAKPEDTSGFDGLTLKISIKSFSRHSGYKEIKSIMSAIYNALHSRDMDHADHYTTSCRFLMSRIENQSEKNIRKSDQIFEIITEPKN
jgi:hypothetical protein